MVLFLIDRKLDLKKLSLHLGLVSLVFLFLTAIQVKTWKNTTALLENSILHHPDDSYLASSLATIYAKSGKIEEAIKICAGPISRGATNYKFYEITGNFLFLKNDFQKAIKYYKDGLSFAKDSLSKNILYRNHGVVYQRIDMSEALKNLEEAYKFKKDADLLKLKGGSLIALKRYKEALDDLNEVQRMGFASDSTFIDMAVAKYELGDKVGAVNDLETALKINPNNTTAKNNLKVLGIN